VLCPQEALLGWAAVAAVATLLLWRARRRWLLWCGLAVAAAGAIYYPAVMAHRPQHYYALFEFLASSLAVGAGLVAAVAGALGLGAPAPTMPPPGDPAEPDAAPVRRGRK
jgi:hypothetical protein